MLIALGLSGLIALCPLAAQSPTDDAAPGPAAETAPAAGSAASADAAAPPESAASAPAAAGPALTRPSFAEWLAGLRAEALQRGDRPDVVDAALATVEEPVPAVIERDRTQAETVLALEKYISRQLRPKVVRTAREMYTRNRKVLDEIGARYGVPPRIVVGIWGIESNFGKFSGVRPTISSLATLAWDTRRGVFFRGELLDALDILNRGDIDVPHMHGSWAGAMGQPQFMPSSYLQWAEDFDGDGRADIWSSQPDVFASIANYLKAHGWTAGQSWGREVKVPPEAAKKIATQVERRDGSCAARRDMTVALPMARWQALGVRLPTGRALPKTGLTASLVSGSSRRFLVYGNYDALLEYNCAHSYAITVALLADRIP
jgi:membrane-bound lytic murein transglycosylase B